MNPGYLNQFTKGTFNFTFENGAKFAVDMKLDERQRMKQLFLKELDEKQMNERVNILKDIMSRSLPNESEKDIETFVMSNEDELVWNVWKSCNWIKTLDGETFSQWDNRVSKEIQAAEAKKKENERVSHQESVKKD